MDHLSKAFEFIYSANQDKQRIAIVGEQGSVIFEMVKHVLKYQHKNTDYVTDGQLTTYTSLTFTDAPVLIVLCAQPLASLLLLQSHVLIISNSLAKNDLSALNQLIDSLPKSGILIADDREPIMSLTKKERSDILTINFRAYTHKIEQEEVILITSTNEKFPLKIKGDENLRNITASKETLKRIGVSSGQFYRAIANFTI